VPGHDLIVVGGSAGGIEALTALVAGLPPELPAAVCVVVHLRPFGVSRLAEVLQRATALPVRAARHGALLERGTIHVAVPDLHLLVERADEGEDAPALLRLTRGPRENRNRPAVDPLFRSAALAFGPRVIGVVLSGALDDGTAGLWAVRDRGGLAVVQDPADALVPSMPRSALNEVGADHVVPADALGPLLDRLAREPAPERDGEAAPSEAVTVLEREVAMAAVDEVVHQREERYAAPSRFACPDCGGVLWHVSPEGPLRFRCETGHAYSPATLEEGQNESVEEALWAALRALEDRIALARLRGRHAERLGLADFAQRFVVQEEASEQHAAAIRALLRLDGRPGTKDASEDALDVGAPEAGAPST
jgi:two-component system chemotaxis response regulator CheB